MAGGEPLGDARCGTHRDGELLGEDPGDHHEQHHEDHTAGEQQAVHQGHRGLFIVQRHHQVQLQSLDVRSHRGSHDKGLVLSGVTVHGGVLHRHPVLLHEIPQTLRHRVVLWAGDVTTGGVGGDDHRFKDRTGGGLIGGHRPVTQRGTGVVDA